MSIGNNESAMSSRPFSTTSLEIGKLGQAAALRGETPSATDTDSVATVILRLLDKVLIEFQETPDSAGPAMYDLQSELGSVKEKSTPEVWSMVTALCLAHPVSDLIHQDPFTRHCFTKPRGYAGDAELLDYLYGVSEAPAGTTPLGRSICNHMMDQQGGRSVRSRGKILARLIDETADIRRQPRILSIACGHLREGVHSQALMSGRISEFVALDQDADSLAHVEQAYAGTNVRTVRASVKSILGGKIRFEGFDFVYAAGLYDYLSERVATRFTRMMFDMLSPGGRLLVANFAPVLPEVGYMETFMDWKLIYRTAEEMSLLSGDIPGSEWKSNRLFWDEPENIVFLELVKRAVVKPELTYMGKGKRFSVRRIQNPTIDRRLRTGRQASTNSSEAGPVEAP
ncbi:MAG TPA: class I SAM-dependent methyltransferase [Tepidisphaeraceae bacterium]|jgi:SAM-dependent methyltransferase|nr:class I SAM-dependent methyltransferase [Tepidisphaeraceae bacterium]